MTWEEFLADFKARHPEAYHEDRLVNAGAKTALSPSKSHSPDHSPNKLVNGATLVKPINQAATPDWDGVELAEDSGGVEVEADTDDDVGVEVEIDKPEEWWNI